jgi:hypothetical protein
MTDEPAQDDAFSRSDDSEARDANILLAIPGLVRIAGTAWWRTTGWTVDVSMRMGSRAVQAAVSGESPAELFREAGAELREYARELLDVEIPGVPGRGPQPQERGARADGEGGTGSLRERGDELLRRSADVHFEEEAHPAYEGILEQLAPDEGRILRLLALEGAQPAVDVRTGGPLTLVISRLIAPGLSMIGPEAGCRYPERIHAYLNNLYRLGLVWFSREPVRDRLRYQVLEAQPEVIEAMRRRGRGRTVRRSIHLTPFGEDFCEICLPLHTDELDALGGEAAR